MGIIGNAFRIAVDKIRNAVVKVWDVMRRFFEKALNMMRTVIGKLENRVRGVILGASHFFRKVGAKYQEGVKTYSLEKEIGEWNETTVTREISLEDIPPQYRIMESEFEIDDTRKLDAALEY